MSKRYLEIPVYFVISLLICFSIYLLHDYSIRLEKAQMEIKERCIGWVMKNSSVITENEAKEIVDFVFDNTEKPFLMLALICVESNFNPKAKSSAGAIGLTQVMPLHIPDLKVKLFKSRDLDERMLYDIGKNIMAGYFILSNYITQEGRDIEKGLKRYFGADSEKYVDKIKTAMFNLLEEIDVGSSILFR